MYSSSFQQRVLRYKLLILLFLNPRPCSICEAWITTYAPGKDLQFINEHFDPLWVSTPVDPGLLPEGPTLQDEVDASNCKTAQDSGADRLEKLRKVYTAIRNERFYHHFARYHIWTFEEDVNEGSTSAATMK